MVKKSNVPKDFTISGQGRLRIMEHGVYFDDEDIDTIIRKAAGATTDYAGMFAKVTITVHFYSSYLTINGAPAETAFDEASNADAETTEGGETM